MSGEDDSKTAVSIGELAKGLTGDRLTSVDAQIDTLLMVSTMSAMRCTLARARGKGRHGWWDEALCPVEELEGMLRAHVFKDNRGNYVDVAILAMMLHVRHSGVLVSEDPPE